MTVSSALRFEVTLSTGPFVLYFLACCCRADTSDTPLFQSENLSSLVRIEVVVSVRKDVAAFFFTSFVAFSSSMKGLTWLRGVPEFGMGQRNDGLGRRDG